MSRYYFICLFLILFGYQVRGQGEIDDQKIIFYRNERSVRFGLNTNGYGLDYRYGKRLDYTDKKLYEIHFDIIKHPKEIKRTNPYYLNSSRFVYGKLNSFASLKFGYGFQKEVFRKIDKGGISIKYFYTYGPSFGFLKAIYYEVYDYTDNKIKEEKYNSVTHSENNTVSQVPFYKHFFDMNIIPGVFVQGGFNFDYSKIDVILHAVEVGAGAELFAKKVALMDLEGQRFFLHLFVRYRFGKIIDPLASKRKKENKRYLREY